MDIGGNSLCLSCKLLASKDKFLCLLGKCWQMLGKFLWGNEVWAAIVTKLKGLRPSFLSRGS